MLKKIKLKNSTLLLIGLIILIIGLCLGFYEYFIDRKNKTFSQMNIILYEQEQPENVEEDININIDTDNLEQNEEPKNDEFNQNINYLGIIEIPKINLKRGFYNLDNKYNNVDYNVTVINGSTMPNVENNNLILAAHSGNCSYCYFDKLYKLNIGDEAYIHYNNFKYIYKIVDIYEVEKDGTVAIYRDHTKSVLTLITCTRNSDTKQTVYILERTN